MQEARLGKANYLSFIYTTTIHHLCLGLRILRRGRSRSWLDSNTPNIHRTTHQVESP